MNYFDTQIKYLEDMIFTLFELGIHQHKIDVLRNAINCVKKIQKDAYQIETRIKLKKDFTPEDDQKIGEWKRYENDIKPEATGRVVDVFVRSDSLIYFIELDRYTYTHPFSGEVKRLDRDVRPLLPFKENQIERINNW